MSDTTPLLEDSILVDTKLKEYKQVNDIFNKVVDNDKDVIKFDEEGTLLLNKLRKRLNETRLYNSILKSCKIQLESSEWMYELRKTIRSTYSTNKPLFESGIDKVTSAVLPTALATIPEETSTLAISKIRRVLRKTLQSQNLLADESENLTASLSEDSGDNLADGEDTELETENVIENENEETEIEDQLMSYSASISDTSSSNTSDVEDNAIEEGRTIEDMDTSEDSISDTDEDTF